MKNTSKEETFEEMAKRVNFRVDKRLNNVDPKRGVPQELLDEAKRIIAIIGPQLPALKSSQTS